MSEGESYTYRNRELSWLDFNYRVLEEARDPSVPLLERLRFLAIFSANLDEFFRVRVATLRALDRMGSGGKSSEPARSAELLREIYAGAERQQEEFGQILRTDLLPELERQGIVLLYGSPLSVAQLEAARREFEATIRPGLAAPMYPGVRTPFLKDRQVYLAVALEGTAERDEEIALVEIPSPPHPRFITMPGEGERLVMAFIDDVMRVNLPRIFPGRRIGGAYAVKVSRDADLHLEDEYSGHIAELIRRGLARREKGMPCRVLYDAAMPPAMLSTLCRQLGLDEDDLVRGGRYHNLHDFASITSIGRDDLLNPPLAPQPHPVVSARNGLLEDVRRKDRLLSLPYQSFQAVTDFLQTAAHDPDVEEIYATLYRTAPKSAVINALKEAARAGKRVTVLVEVKARFDEAANLDGAAEMEEAGIKTFYSLPRLKVHAKMLLVGRREGGEIRDYAYLATGNLNEKTARVYADHGLFTADRRLTDDVREVFRFLAGEVSTPDCRHILVAPFTLRDRLYALMDRQVEAVEAGRRSEMLLKMNSLEDPRIIRRLYLAARAGVDVKLIIRGICCLAPEVTSSIPTISARRIVDRFLEHARIFVFHVDDEQSVFLASADWMTRNLDRRIEVAFPIFDDDVRQELVSLLDLQLADNVKARRLAGPPPDTGSGRVRAQIASYERFRHAEFPIHEPEHSSETR